MAKDSSFHDYVMNELFVNMEGIRSRPMFGGWGIYKDDMFFSLVSSGQLFLK